MIKLLDIIEEGVLSEAETAVQAVDNLVQKAEKAGADIEDEKVQLDLLNKMIDTNFNLDKINPNQIAEYYEDLKEAAASSLKDGVKGISPKLMEKIAKILRIDVKIVQTALYWIKKIAGFFSTVVDRLFFTIARYLGADINNAKIAGRGGLALVSLIGIIYGLIHFPAIVAAITGSLGLIGLAKLGYALVKSIRSIKTMWGEIKSALLEHSQYTTSDFLGDIEKKYMETKGSKGEKISTKWIYQLSDWYDNLDKQKQESASKWMEQVAQSFNAGDYKRTKGFIDTYLNKMGNENTIKIFNTLQSYIEPNSSKLEEIAREILSNNYRLKYI
jgi:hypothetical protein